MTLTNAIQSYKQLELLAHVDLNDVIIKVSQELLEMLEAKANNALEELEKETADTIVNILSASNEVGITPNEEKTIKKSEVSDSALLMTMKQWLQSVQAIRQRYSRDKVSREELTTVTEEFLSQILSYGNTQKSLEEILKHNTEKFSQRIEKYKPHIDLKSFIHEYPDFPKPPVLFKDISPLLRSPEVMKYLCFELAAKAKGADVIAGLDARGFLFGPKVAELLNIPFVMIRKPGKLPGDTYQQTFEKEYGTDTIEIQSHAIEEGQKVVIIDDLLATGGTVDAAATLVEKSGGIVHKILSVVQLDDEFCSSKRDEYDLARYNVESVLHYER